MSMAPRRDRAKQSSTNAGCSTGILSTSTALYQLDQNMDSIWSRYLVLFRPDDLTGNQMSHLARQMAAILPTKRLDPLPHLLLHTC